MVKRSDTCAGSATLGTDRVTYSKIKSLAVKNRLTIADTVRELVNQATSGQSATMINADRPATKADIKDALDSVISTIKAWEAEPGHPALISILTAPEAKGYTAEDFNRDVAAAYAKLKAAGGDIANAQPELGLEI